jgi:hypothetical protein
MHPPGASVTLRELHEAFEPRYERVTANVRLMMGLRWVCDGYNNDDGGDLLWLMYLII